MKPLYDMQPPDQNTQDCAFALKLIGSLVLLIGSAALLLLLLLG